MGCVTPSGYMCFEILLGKVFRGSSRRRVSKDRGQVETSRPMSYCCCPPHQHHQKKKKQSCCHHHHHHYHHHHFHPLSCNAKKLDPVPVTEGLAPCNSPCNFHNVDCISGVKPCRDSYLYKHITVDRVSSSRTCTSSTLERSSSSSSSGSSLGEHDKQVKKRDQRHCQHYFNTQRHSGDSGCASNSDISVTACKPPQMNNFNNPTGRHHHGTSDTLSGLKTDHMINRPYSVPASRDGEGGPRRHSSSGGARLLGNCGAGASVQTNSYSPQSNSDSSTSTTYVTLPPSVSTAVQPPPNRTIDDEPIDRRRP